MASFDIQAKWFAEDSPINANEASATLTFTDVVIAAETVTIGDEVYEFVADAEDVTEGNIAVVVGVTLTADNAVTKLAEAIEANSSLVTAVADVDEDTCVVSYVEVARKEIPYL